MKSSATILCDPQSKDEIEKNSQRAERIEINDSRRWISRTETAEVDASSFEIAHSSGTTETFTMRRGTNALRVSKVTG